METVAVHSPLHLHLTHLFLFLLLLLLPLLLRVLLLFLRRQRTAASSTRLPLPPSPSGIPILGNLHQLGSLPHRTLRAMAARHGPIMLIQLGQVPALVVSSVDMAREVLKEQDHIFASRPPLKVPDLLFRDGGDVAFAPYGNYWRQVKKVSLLHLLSAKMVRSFGTVRREEVACLTDEISQACSSGPVDVTGALKSLTNHIISRVTLGSSSKREAWGRQIVDVLGEASMLAGAFHTGDYFPSLPWLSRLSGLEERVKRVFDVVDPILDDIIETHRRRSREDERETDFVDILLSLQEDPEMTSFISDGTIKGIVTDMFAAGTDSTHIVIEWAMAELIRNPETMKKLQDEVRSVAGSKQTLEEEDLVDGTDYLRAVTKESMRLHPPGTLLVPRELMEETTIAGYRIPKGARTFVNVWAIGRDPSIWEAPDDFRPERFLGSSVDYRGQHFELAPFGAGRRMCPGIGFSVTIIELALANLMLQFDWKLPDGTKEEDMDMIEAFGITTRIKSGLRLVATPRF
ncbi:cytochrome P450 [Musa troglodytarum]|uniref:Cytochrome P450 n=1 Tax=Musa troglodytarum TaxID=320322 RepID=A0A9E7GWQ4_9LILI|nr:cytochrome P450 [Musa troglodytarum]